MEKGISMKSLFGFLEFILIIMVVFHVLRGCHSNEGLIKYSIGTMADICHYADSVFNEINE